MPPERMDGTPLGVGGRESSPGYDTPMTGLVEDESFKKNRPNFYFDFGGYEPKFRETFVKEIPQALKFQKKIELTHSLA